MQKGSDGERSLGNDKQLSGYVQCVVDYRRKRRVYVCAGLAKRREDLESPTYNNRSENWGPSDGMMNDEMEGNKIDSGGPTPGTGVD